MSSKIASLLSLCVEKLLDSALAATLQKRIRAQTSEAEDDESSVDSLDKPTLQQRQCTSQTARANPVILSEIADRLLALFTNTVLFDEEIAKQLFGNDDRNSLLLCHKHKAAQNSVDAPQPIASSRVICDVRSLRIIYDEYRVKRIAEALQQILSARALTSFDCQASESPLLILNQLVSNSTETLRSLRFSETEFYEETHNTDADVASSSGDENTRGYYFSANRFRLSDDETKVTQASNDSENQYDKNARARACMGESIGQRLCELSRLTVLSVSNTDLNDADLTIVCSKLQLRVLNVAFCRELTDLKPVRALSNSLRELVANHVPLGNSAKALRSLDQLVRLDVAIHGEPFVRKLDAAAVNVLLGASETLIQAAETESDSESDLESNSHSNSNSDSASSDWELDWLLQRNAKSKMRPRRLKRSRRETQHADQRGKFNTDCNLLANKLLTKLNDENEPCQPFWPKIRYVDVSGWNTLRFDVLERFVKDHPTLRSVSVVLAGSTADAHLFETLRCDSTLRYLAGLTQFFNVPQVNSAFRDRRLLSDERAAYKQLQSLVQLLEDHEKAMQDRHLIPALMESLINVTQAHVDSPAIVSAGIRCLFTLTVDYVIRVESEALAARLVELLVSALERIEYGRSSVEYVNTLVQQSMRILYRCVVNGHSTPSNDMWFCRTIMVVVNAISYHFNMNRQILGMDALCTLNILTQRWKRATPLDFALKQESMRALVEKLVLALSAAVSEFASSVVQADEMAGELHNGLRAALSTLTRVTDENPLACEMFAKYSLPIHLRFIKMCTNRIASRGPHRVLAIAHHHESFLFSVNNVVEVTRLRRFFTPEYVETICNDLLHPSFEIVYHACSILSNLICTMREEPNLSSIFESTLSQLGRGVERLDTLLKHSQAIGIFYTLSPLYRMIQQPIEVVQFFACWTITYLIERDSDRYLLMMSAENARTCLQSAVLDNEVSSDRCKKLAKHIVERIGDYFSVEDDVQ